MDDWYKRYAVLMLIGALWFIGYYMIDWSEMNSTTWAAWVQAVGSIAALVGAYVLGKQQAASALATIREAERLSAAQSAKAIAAIATAAEEQAVRMLDVFQENGFSYIYFRLADFDIPLENVNSALHGIPMHEVGSFPAVTALISLKTSIQYAQGAIKRVHTHCGTSGPITDRQEYDTGVLRLCADNTIRNANALKIALVEDL